MSPRRIIYLMQGKASFVQPFLTQFQARDDADSLFLSYDEPLDGAIYYPNSVWSDGRNRLLQEARAQAKDYLYYVFLDDDIAFTKGSFELFERQLLQYQPAVAVAVNDKLYNKFFGLGIKNRLIPFLNVQPFLVNDEQFIAFHRDVIQDGLVMPYFNKFDHLSWFYSSYIQETILQTFYFPHVLQFNNIIVRNLCHRVYTRKYFWEDDNMMKWLSDQFVSSYQCPQAKALTFNLRRDPRLLVTHPIEYLRLNILRWRILKERLAYAPKTSYRLSRESIRAILNPRGDLYAHYLAA